jgi:transglutaminase-like putative cysteine protease
VSGLAAHVEAPLAPPAGSTAARRIDENVAGVLRLLAFAAFASYSLGHWLSVLQNPPVGRGMLVLAICVLGAAALWATGIEERPSRLAVAARPLIVLAMALLSLLAAGLPLHYLSPHHHGWHKLGTGLNHGLVGAQATIYPYTGGDHWVRLTLVLAVPLFLVPAAALAFWPAPKWGAPMRATALVLLVALFCLALAERTPNGQLWRGLVLLLLFAAWLWLPRLRARDAAAAGMALGAAAVLALPIAAKLDVRHGWFDYRNWRVLSAQGGVTYSWDQTYGPINWPRRGVTLMFVKADRPYYWKAETLDNFVGTRWVGGDVTSGPSDQSETPPLHDRRWLKQITVNVAGLRGSFVPVTGMPLEVSPDAGDTTTGPDGTTVANDHELRNAEHYTVDAYIPEPSANEMRAAPAGYDPYFMRYTSIALPRTGGSLQTVNTGLRGMPRTEDPIAPSELLHSPYAGMYRVARGLAAGKPTAYDVAQKIQNYLRGPKFIYSERPPVSKYPLESFVMKTHTGYCQQFSGTMALMLRMEGIPARVVSGFAPGTPVTDSPGEYRVRDFDAHSWVEVYFRDIGWVTFDPTPPLSPASSQLDDAGVGAIQGGRTPRGLGQSQAPDVRDAGGAVAGAGKGSGHLGLWLLAAGLAAVALLVLAGLWLRSWLVRRRAGGDAAEAALHELRRALERVGFILPPGTTLASLEKRLQTAAGADAVSYARRLREQRYGPGEAELPGPSERRALRRALARAAGPFGRLKALRALPPAPRMPWRA